MDEGTKRKWIVVYFDETGEVATPVWEVESKIKPTRWAKQAFATWNLTFKIKEVASFSERGYKDSYLKSLA